MPEQAALLPAEPPPQAGTIDDPVPTGLQALVAVIERLAANPQVDVEKMERVIDLQRSIMRDNARAAFAADYARMAPHIPVIDERGRIEVKERVRSTYAPLEDIHSVVKPICSEYGFAIRHRTEWPADKPNVIRIVGILTHVSGHFEESVFEAPADKSDFRSDIQSMGSTVSYGRRYTTMDLLNIATRKQDNDGQKREPELIPEPPDGFEKRLAHLELVAAKGLKAFEPAWETLEGEHKNYLHRYHKDKLKALKETAAKAGK